MLESWNPGPFAEMDLSPLLVVNKYITSLGGPLLPCFVQIPPGQHPIPHLDYFLIAVSQSEIILSISSKSIKPGQVGSLIYLST